MDNAAARRKARFRAHNRARRMDAASGPRDGVATSVDCDAISGHGRTIMAQASGNDTAWRGPPLDLKLLPRIESAPLSALRACHTGDDRCARERDEGRSSRCGDGPPLSDSLR